MRLKIVLSRYKSGHKALSMFRLVSRGIEKAHHSQRPNPMLITDPKSSNPGLSSSALVLVPRPPHLCPARCVMSVTSDCLWWRWGGSWRRSRSRRTRRRCTGRRSWRCCGSYAGCTFARVGRVRACLGGARRVSFWAWWSSHCGSLNWRALMWWCYGLAQIVPRRTCEVRRSVADCPVDWQCDITLRVRIRGESGWVT